MLLLFVPSSVLKWSQKHFTNFDKFFFLMCADMTAVIVQTNKIVKDKNCCYTVSRLLLRKIYCLSINILFLDYIHLYFFSLLPVLDFNMLVILQTYR